MSVQKPFTPKMREGQEPITAKQEHKQDSDIVAVFNRAKEQNFAPGTIRTNIQRKLSNAQPMWGEIPSTDFQEFSQIVDNARQQFRKLPAAVRDFFNNDPKRLLEYIENPANHPHCVKMKIMTMPEGYTIDRKTGKFIPLEETGVVPYSPPQAPTTPSTPPAPKADPEANPNFQKPS